jgi:hypothetical protein
MEDMTGIDMVEELFPRLVSVGDSPTVAVFVIAVSVVLAFTSAAMVSVTVELGARVPIVHVSVELAYVDVPTVVVAPSNVRSDGKVSLATTSVDASGPFAVTVIV